MLPSERRQAIIELLCQRKHETMKNMASEFGVSIRTIRYDIEILSLYYPLTTVPGRYSGGVYVVEDFRLRKRYLSPVQKALLERLASTLIGEDLEIMLSILRDFALKRV